MNFASDNWAGAHPKITASLAASAAGFAQAYGNSKFDQLARERFSQIFEREVAVFFVATGTAANALAMTAVNRPGGIALCHPEAHVIEDECGATGYLSDGARFQPVEGELGRVDPAGLKRVLGKFDPEFVHGGQPMAITITQATEVGTVYGLEQIAAISTIARRHGLPLHMDGARFANALVALGATPAEMTWKRGIDILSFGGTKNGCWCAEALVFFDPAKAKDVPFLRMRAGQLFSKSRFIAAQFSAYFQDELWLETATHANAKAAHLAGHIRSSGKLRLAWQPEANEVFAIMRKDTAAALKEKGAVFHSWNIPHGFKKPIGEGETLCRFVASFATTEAEVDRFGALIT
jgi:threonine aldolase